MTGCVQSSIAAFSTLLLPSSSEYIDVTGMTWCDAKNREAIGKKENVLPMASLFLASHQACLSCMLHIALSASLRWRCLDAHRHTPRPLALSQALSLKLETPSDGTAALLH